MKLDILTTLNAERAARRAAIVVTDVTSGQQRLVKAADVAKDPLSAVLAEHLRTGKSGMEEAAAGPGFPHRLCAGAATGDHRRGAYQPGAGADRKIARL